MFGAAHACPPEGRHFGGEQVERLLIHLLQQRHLPAVAGKLVGVWVGEGKAGCTKGLDAPCAVGRGQH